MHEMKRLASLIRAPFTAGPGYVNGCAHLLCLFSENTLVQILLLTYYFPEVIKLQDHQSAVRDP